MHRLQNNLPNSESSVVSAISIRTIQPISSSIASSPQPTVRTTWVTHVYYVDSCLNLNETVDYNPRHFSTFPPAGPSNPQLFDSNFECGNLLYAYESAESTNEYDLVLQNDFNTKGYNQWFYFSFRSESPRTARLNIVNMVKKRSLFTEGVRPVWFRITRPELGWHSTANQVNYYRSLVYRDNG